MEFRKIESWLWNIWRRPLLKVTEMQNRHLRVGFTRFDGHLGEAGRMGVV